jgi:cytochrome d ubiquinol oxidase subunit I
MGPLGFVAVLAGWFVTEVGRQPYTVSGLLRTADSASPIGAPGVAGSLLGFFVVYLLVFGAGSFYLVRLMRRDPDDPRLEPLRKGPLRTAGSGRDRRVRTGAAQESC